jgi:uncharacterized protein (DUF305 family)
VIRRAVAAALVVLGLAGCGGDGGGGAEAPPPVDDAFVVRLLAQQQAGAEVVRYTGERIEEADVKRLVRRMERLREPRITELAAANERVRSREDLGDLGVSVEQAAENIGPTALVGVEPITPGFLALMTRHNEGAIALARAEIKRGTRPETKELARRVIAESQRELTDIGRALQQTR